VTDEGVPVPKIDTSVPHSARIWNYWLGGKDNYLVPPGLVRVADWRPDPSPFPPVQVDTLAGVGRKRATT
jgi:S-adenosyl methyltransferase